MKPALNLIAAAALALPFASAHATWLWGDTSHEPTQQTKWGVGSNGSLQWEQLRFYAPSGSSSKTYPQGEPTYLGQVSPDYCSGSGANCGLSMRFDTKLVGTVTVTASDDNGTTPNTTAGAVIQDLKPHYGGLGVVSLKDSHHSGKTVSSSNPDQIDTSDTLTFTFGQPVQIVGLHLFDADHDEFKSKDKGTFSILANDKLYDYKLNTSYFWFGANSPLIGTEFTFIANDTPFYVGALKVAAIPEPGTYALVGVGLMAAGFVARRRRAEF